MEIVSKVLKIPQGQTADSRGSYAVYIAILLFYLAFAYFMYPETKHHSIEEVSTIFDRRNGDMDELNHVAMQKVEKGNVGTFEHRE